MEIRKLLWVLLLITVSSSAWAQGAFRYGPDERAGEWNLSLELLYQGSESFSGSNGSGAELQADWGFGFMIAYNFNNHLALGFEASFQDPRYNYTIVPEDSSGSPGAPQTVSHTASIFNGLFRGTYNILSGPVTPFIDVLAGWRYIDSNVANSPPVTGCWWDPWWGYVCRNYWSTYSDSSFSYGAGVGMRWDFNRDMFLKASYSLQKTDTGSSGDPTFDVGRIEIGWRY